MNIGLVSDSLSDLSFDELLTVSAKLGIDSIEFTTGNWSSAPHLNTEKLLNSSAARQEFLKKLADHGLVISGLNASGNPLHPGPTGAEHNRCLLATLELASLLEVENVITMSGLPGGAPGDISPNWIVSSWSPETQQFLSYQWQIAEQYWTQTAELARRNGCKVCIELHGQQLAYNLPSFRKLREITGPVLGLNLDPSHILWMGGDPLEFIRQADP